jgi:hypothetical protein
MMQKRTLYISLLLVSCLLFFGFSYASAQSVSFQSKTVGRCDTVMVNVTVDYPGTLSALELIFEATGDYSSMSVAWAGGFTDLDRRVDPIIAGDVVRMAAFKGTSCDCFDANGGVVVAEITFITADVCSGTIDMLGSSVQGGCCGSIDAATGLVDCGLFAVATTVTPGSLTIVNNAPVITCPNDTTVHWDTDVVDTWATAVDPDNCENLTFSSSDGNMAANGHYTWNPGGDDVGNHTITVVVTDKCGAVDSCQFDICVYNIPPVVTNDSTWYCAVWGIQLAGTAEAYDPDGGPSSLLYTILSFDGPTWFGSGIQMNSATGDWTWDIGADPEYLGDFDLCFIVSDGANTDPDCSPENADTGCVHIHTVGFAISIEKVHDQIQGQNTEVSIYLDSAFMPDVFLTDFIGGFDFLIAYDASALTALSAEPGALIDDGKFEYFTYRFGPFGNCGNGCPSGMMRIVGMRETNDGILNTYHITGPGELVKLHFYVTNDRTFECMYAPIKFFWLDCGDNTISDESGNWLHMGIKVYDFEWNEITDPVEFGYTGPMAECFDTVYSSDQMFKNAPIGSIIFRNAGVDIICADSIDDRGDINLNGVANEIADAVVFTNYFIYGLAAFTINLQGQIAATEINGDGYVLTVADLVYLVRVVVGDANPLPKVNPNAYANFNIQGPSVTVETNVALGAVAFVFDGQVTPTLGPDAEHMELISYFDGSETRALMYSLSPNAAIGSGEILNVSGQGTLSSVETAEFLGARIVNLETNILPTDYKLSQNYPNPFNPQTSIDLALPVASQWSLSIYNVAGQRVADFSGYSEAGIVTVSWDANGMSSGMYFYKAVAGNFADTKKMVLLK